MRAPLFELDPGALAARLGGPGRARQVFRALKRGLDPLAPDVLPRSLAARLAEATSFAPLPVEGRAASADGTTKLLLRLDDGRAVEAVLIPEPRRTTLCVSSQVGCGRGCRFCLTASMGLVRSLSAAEIVGQVHRALGEVEALGLPPLRNLVFMGMGEPLDNAEAVTQAVRILVHPQGFELGPRHVTVSTVGPSPAAVRAAAALPVPLAWSLHAARDEVRARLVPTARHPVAELAAAFAEVTEATGRGLFVELTLVEGVNDAPADADAVLALFSGFPGTLRFNLLPMNPVATSPLAPSPAERVAAFKARLVAAGRFTTVREARGDERSAACGQLATLPPRRTSAR